MGRVRPKRAGSAIARRSSSWGVTRRTDPLGSGCRGGGGRPRSAELRNRAQPDLVRDHFESPPRRHSGRLG
ncbi:hypothetical protein FRUB_01989 [Fimbriiglobus ruber]|uniref:Uncharacterized protein n=1 Tax=Fimbriiglobus ruber TaxID=1908690 RepID=A0A225E4D2_9BACT|nr:hypothetical protein FRUB_01989 [Fimbriiglobus ruber]